jgi:hypothetical protein
MLPGIDADMREFGQSGIRKHERELRNRDAVDHAEITRRPRGLGHGVASAIAFVEGRDARAKGGTVPVLTGHRPTVGIGQRNLALAGSLKISTNIFFPFRSPHTTRTRDRARIRPFRARTCQAGRSIQCASRILRACSRVAVRPVAAGELRGRREAVRR